MQRSYVFVLGLAGWLWADPARAQGAPGSIRGTVQNAAGAPLAQVSVVVDGTRLGGVTGTDGRYVIARVPAGSYTVRTARIGYAPATRPVSVPGGQTVTVDFQLTPIAVQLDAVVATGYRVQNKSEVTGSVTSVSADEFKDVPADNLSNALAGRLSGVVITQNAGTPGRESSIRVRAVGTFNNADPLYVVDGVVTDKFAFDGLSTDEVQSISILKDGAAASVYGSRAANGVVLVTTKRGRLAAPSFSYTGSVGTQSGTRIPRALGAYQQAKAINDALAYNAIPGNDARYYTKDELDYFAAHDYNWLDYLWRAPRTQQHALNVTGGSDAVRYYLGGSLVDESGSFDNLNFRRYTSRANVDVDITSRLQAAVDLSSAWRDRLGPSWGGDDWAQTDLYKALNLRSSMVPPYVRGMPTGNWVEWHPGVVIGDQQGYDRRDYASYDTKLRLTYRVPRVEGLSAKASFYKGFGEQHRKQFNLPYQMAMFNTLGANNHIVGDSLVGWKDRVQPEFLMSREDRDNNYQANGQLDYKRSFGAHNVNALAVYEQARQDHVWFSGRRDKFISPLVDQFVGGASDQAQADGSESQGARVSYVGALGYDYAARYFLQGSFRYDGSVIFAPERRWGLFPAVSGGWRVSEEPFFKRHVGFVNELKLRASYGLVGNDAVGSFQWQQAYSIQPGAVFAAPTTGLTPGKIANRDLTWEKSKSFDAGADARLWGDHVSLTVDLFRRHTYDILGSPQDAVPDTFGASLSDKNYQAIDSHGFELELGYDNRVGGRTQALNYYVRGNVGFATNKILRLNEAQNIRPYQSRVGRTTAPSGSCFGYVAAGILRTADDLAKLPAGYTILGLAPRLGMLNYQDLRGPTGDQPDGKITSDDQQWICNYDAPPATFGLTLGGAWKRLRLDVLVQGAAGNRLMMTTNGRDIQARAEESSYRYWADSWTPDNPDGKYPGWRDTGFRTRYPASTFWLRDGSFARLKNVTLSYELPAAIAGRFGTSGARLYVNGANLGLLHDKIGDWGYDPEMADIRGYPLMRTVTMGVDVSVKRRTAK